MKGPWLWSDSWPESSSRQSNIPATVWKRKRASHMNLRSSKQQLAEGVPGQVAKGSGLHPGPVLSGSDGEGKRAWIVQDGSRSWASASSLWSSNPSLISLHYFLFYCLFINKPYSEHLYVMNIFHDSFHLFFSFRTQTSRYPHVTCD